MNNTALICLSFGVPEPHPLSAIVFGVTVAQPQTKPYCTSPLDGVFRMDLTFLALFKFLGGSVKLL